MKTSTFEGYCGAQGCAGVYTIGCEGATGTIGCEGVVTIGVPGGYDGVNNIGYDGVPNGAAYGQV